MEELQLLTENVEVHQTLGDNPNTDDNLSADELKKKFDEPGRILKKFINEKIIPFVNGLNGQFTQQIDNTLSRAGYAADAYATGKAVADRVPVSRKVNNRMLSEDIVLTAADIGARPDNWTPTAADVGARPNNWTPSAADVGARPDTWLPTPKEIGALSMGLLWENASPASAFAAQTVEIDLSDYLGVFIYFRNQTVGSVYNSTGFIAKGDEFTLVYVPTTASSAVVTRKGTVDENGVNFLTTSNDTTNYDIPLKIYGIKGVIA